MPIHFRIVVGGRDDRIFSTDAPDHTSDGSECRSRSRSPVLRSGSRVADHHVLALVGKRRHKRLFMQLDGQDGHDTARHQGRNPGQGNRIGPENEPWFLSQLWTNHNVFSVDYVAVNDWINTRSVATMFIRRTVNRHL